MAARAPRAKKETAAESPADLAPIVGANLRRLREQRGLSLQQLADQSAVSRAMLGQIELGQSAPTINVLWKIARALDITFSTLLSAPGEGGTVILRGTEARRLTSHDGAFVSRALFPQDQPRRVEFYQLKLAAKKREVADPHPAGTKENLYLAAGEIEILSQQKSHKLRTGDAILFDADSPHSYVNTGTTEAVMYLVMTYAEPQS